MAWQRANGGCHWPRHLRVGRATPGLPVRSAHGGGRGRRGGRRGGAHTSAFRDARQERLAAGPWHCVASRARASAAQEGSGHAPRRRQRRPRRRALGRARPGPRPPGPVRRSGSLARGAGGRAWSAAAASVVAPRGAATRWRMQQARPQPGCSRHRAERAARCMGAMAGSARCSPVRRQTRGLLSQRRAQQIADSPCPVQAGCCNHAARLVQSVPASLPCRHRRRTRFACSSAASRGPAACSSGAHRARSVLRGRCHARRGPCCSCIAPSGGGASELCGRRQRPGAAWRPG